MLNGAHMAAPTSRVMIFVPAARFWAPRSRWLHTEANQSWEVLAGGWHVYTVYIPFTLIASINKW